MVDLRDAHGNTRRHPHRLRRAAPGSRWWPASAACATSTATCASRPRLPAEWERLRFRVQVRGQVVEVDMTHAGTTYKLIEGRGLPIKHFGEQLRVLPGVPVSITDLPMAA